MNIPPNTIKPEFTDWFKPEPGHRTFHNPLRNTLHHWEYEPGSYAPTKEYEYPLKEVGEISRNAGEFLAEVLSKSGKETIGLITQLEEPSKEDLSENQIIAGEIIQTIVRAAENICLMLDEIIQKPSDQLLVNSRNASISFIKNFVIQDFFKALKPGINSQPFQILLDRVNTLFKKASTGEIAV